MCCCNMAARSCSNCVIHWIHEHVSSNHYRWRRIHSPLNLTSTIVSSLVLVKSIYFVNTQSITDWAAGNSTFSLSWLLYLSSPTRRASPIWTGLVGWLVWHSFASSSIHFNLNNHFGISKKNSVTFDGQSWWINERIRGSTDAVPPSTRASSPRSNLTHRRRRSTHSSRQRRIDSRHS